MVTVSKQKIAGFVILVLPVLIWFGRTVWINASTVAKTGQCFEAGIPPRPCTLLEYLTSHVWTSSSMGYTLLIAALWWGSIIPLWLIYPATQFLKRRLPSLLAFAILGLCLVVYIRFLFFAVPMLLALLQIFFQSF